MRLLLKLLFVALPSLCGWHAALADEEAGRIVALEGSAEIIAADGSPREAQRGAWLHTAEALRTANGAHTQLRMSDGSVVALFSSSEFRVKEYQPQGGNQAASFIYELSHGRLRAVVGRGRFRLDTPLGTLASNDAPTLECALDNGLYCTLHDSTATLSNQRSALQLGWQADFDHGLIVTPNSRPLGLLWLPWPLSEPATQASAPTAGPSVPPPPARERSLLGTGLPAPKPIVITPNRRQP